MAARVEEEDRAEREYRRAIQNVLDEGLGACYMLEPCIASLVEGALRFFDEQRYSLCAWSVMPNHVHSIYRSFPGWPLDRILHSWKSYTGSEANKMLNRRGEVWQEEYFDVLIRDARELQATVRYVLENPLKAGLRDWKWVGSKAETIAALL